jgi:hypothetical protein
MLAYTFALVGVESQIASEPFLVKHFLRLELEKLKYVTLFKELARSRMHALYTRAALSEYAENGA